MDLLSSTQSAGQIKNIIHEDTQLHESSIDLTVNEIHKFTKAGSLDFGGSEFKAAETQLVTPQKQNKDDDYGWWKLKQGCHKCLFNEAISIEDSLAIITLHEHAKEAGLIANTLLFVDVTEELSFNFDAPIAGCNIKENARIATAYLVKL